jgi:hypothetical protein
MLADLQAHTAWDPIYLAALYTSTHLHMYSGHNQKLLPRHPPDTPPHLLKKLLLLLSMSRSSSVLVRLPLWMR